MSYKFSFLLFLACFVFLINLGFSNAVNTSFDTPSNVTINVWIEFPSGGQGNVIKVSCDDHIESVSFDIPNTWPNESESVSGKILFFNDKNKPFDPSIVSFIFTETAGNNYKVSANLTKISPGNYKVTFNYANLSIGSHEMGVFAKDCTGGSIYVTQDIIVTTKQPAKIPRLWFIVGLSIIVGLFLILISLWISHQLTKNKS